MDSKTLSIIIKARDEASATIQGIGNVTNKVGDAFLTMSKVAGLAGIAAVGAFSVSAIKNAADYQQSLAVFNSVAGATAEQMVQVGQKAKELGNDITLPGISAADAAQAMTELAKAGISVNDTLAASKGVLSLAKAGQLEVADAATITARALNTFGLAGDQAGKVADLLAAGANSSTAGVSDMAMALAQGGAGAKQFGISISDTVTALALFSNAGINGSDAGTSLKTMLQNLANPTTAATDEMTKLNLKFFDAQGNFVGLESASEQLKTSLSKLTVEQKNAALSIIFGSDSSRVAAILADGGAEAFDKMSASVNKQGAATDLAKAQNSGFNGALDNLKSTIETVGIEIGSKLLPVLTTLATNVANEVQPAMDKAKEIFKQVAPVIVSVATQVGSYLYPKLQQLFTVVKNDLVPQIKLLWQAIQPLITIIGGTFVVALGAAISLLTFAAAHFQTLIVVAGGLAAGIAAVKFVTLIAGLVSFIATGGLATVAAQALGTALTFVYSSALGPLGIALGVVVGLFAALGLTQQASSTSSDTLSGAIGRQRAAQDALTQANKDAKQAEDILSGAKLDAEGASLRLETAQRDATKAVKDFGPDSLEARTALYEVKRATQDVADANANVEDKATKAAAAQQTVIDKKEEVKKANYEVASSAQSAASGYKSLAAEVSAYSDAVKKGDNAKVNQVQVNAFKVPVAGARASGGTVIAGRSYVVGENEAELFTPSVSGRILNQDQIGKQGGSSTNNVVNFYGDITLPSADAVDAFAKRFSFDKEMGSLGVGV